MMILHIERDFVAAASGGHKSGLLGWADSIGLSTATRLPGAGVVAVTTAVRGRHVRKGRAETILVSVHTISDSRSELWSSQNAGHCPRCNIDYIVNRASTLRETGKVSRQEA
jgi:hypothetical protein